MTCSVMAPAIIIRITSAFRRGHWWRIGVTLQSSCSLGSRWSIGQIDGRLLPPRCHRPTLSGGAWLSGFSCSCFCSGVLAYSVCIVRMNASSTIRHQYSAMSTTSMSICLKSETVYWCLNSLSYPYGNTWVWCRRGRIRICQSEEKHE